MVKLTDEKDKVRSVNIRIKRFTCMNECGFTVRQTAGPAALFINAFLMIIDDFKVFKTSLINLF